MIGIYKIVNPKGRIYIGQSWNIEDRKNKYNSNNCKTQRYLYNSLKKYGFDKHTFEILQELSEDTTQDILDQYETFYWKECKEKGYRMLNVREPGSRGKNSEETKRKIGESMLSTKYIIEKKIKIKVIYKNNIFEYNSLRDASRDLNIRCSTISRCLNKGIVYKNEYSFLFYK